MEGRDTSHLAHLDSCNTANCFVFYYLVNLLASTRDDDRILSSGIGIAKLV